MIGELQCVVLDCPDPSGLARFYQALVGGEVNRPDPRWGVSDTFATLHLASGVVLTFQGARDYQAPRWPDPRYPQQIHLDVEVPDLEVAQAQVEAHGGSLLHVDHRGWRVFADPAGHPFCLLRGTSRTKDAAIP